MIKKLRVTKTISQGEYIGVNALLIAERFTTDRVLQIGQTVKLINGVVVSVVKTESYTTHNA